jgi:hypothetical protein
MPGLPPLSPSALERPRIGDQWLNPKVERFRKGERVVCLDDAGTQALVAGLEYTVDADYGDINGGQLIYLEGHPDNCPFAATRFARPHAISLTETEKAEVRNWDSAEERGVKLPSEEAGDAVNLPPHYARFKIEPIRFLVENFGPSILVGKIVKYSMRYDAKNGLEDVKKAARCLQMLQAYLEQDPDWWKRKAA